MAARAATRPEILAALRRADAAKDEVAAARLKKLYDATPEEPAAPVEEDYGPLGLGDNFARAGQTLDDSMRLLIDTGSRGYVDKWLGPEEQAKTAAARERQGWGGTAVDVAGAVATSPYRVGSMAVGAGLGALEGAASSYGHSDSWIPDPVQIAKDAALGGATGGFGAKVGEWFGGNRALKDTKAAQVYQTDDALRSAADDAARMTPDSPRTADLDARVARVEEVRGAPDRDSFARLRGGNDAETEMIGDIVNGKKSLRERFAGQLGKTSLTGGGTDTRRVLADIFGPTGGAATAVGTASDLLGLSSRMRAVPAKEAERLAALIRDPHGRGWQLDPTTIDAWRGNVSKAAAGYGREP